MQNQSGQSLVQVLIGVAIMGIVMMAMQSMFTIFNRETTGISEKLGSLDLEKVLIASLADGSVCQYLSTSFSTFDSTATISANAPITLPTNSPIYASYTPANGAIPAKLGPVVAQANTTASVNAKNLMVKKISLQITGKGSSPDTFTGNWLVEFDNSQLVRPLRPVTISTTIKADVTSPGSAKILGCQGKGGAAGPSGNGGDWCGGFQGWDDGLGNVGVNNIVAPCKGITTLSCPPGTTKMGSMCIDGGGVGHPFNSSALCPSGYTLTNMFPTGPGGGGSSSYYFSCIAN